MTTLIIIYLVSFLLALYIAYYIFNDDWDSYMAGGSTECILTIIFSFIPFVNTFLVIFIGGDHLIKKLKNKKEN